ncbi:MAG: hypothetical protein JWN96_503, partial [Mycobacterium sp.]|nr:hypothetical protein [Mycobacterium sp.]
MDAIAAAAVLAALDSSSLDLLARRLRVVAGLLRDLAAVVLRASSPGWSGAGKLAYEASASRAITQLRGQAAAFEAASEALGALCTTLRSVQAEAVRARRIAAVQEPASALTWQSPVNGQLELALQAFDDADRRAAAVLMDALRGLPHLLPADVFALPLAVRAAELVSTSTRPPPLPTNPMAVALWWAGLPALTQAGLRSAAAGRALAEVDGIPARIRDATNRMRLAGALQDAERKYEAAARGVWHDLRNDIAVIARHLPWPLSSVSKLMDPDLQRWKRRVDALRDLTRQVARPGSELLVFDPAGDGRAVVASGEVESGDAIAVVGPGMNTELDNVASLIRESDALAGAAGASVVAVAWLGYDAPNLLQVAGDKKAKTGARALNQFTAGLRATAQQVQRVTVIGHSYGTLVAGLAARSAPAEDDLVLLASPGVEATSAAQLKVPTGHVWVARAGTDPIQVVFWPAKFSRFLGLPAPLVFGPDPAST